MYIKTYVAGKDKWDQCAIDQEGNQCANIQYRNHFKYPVCSSAMRYHLLRQHGPSHTFHHLAPFHCAAGGCISTGGGSVVIKPSIATSTRHQSRFECRSAGLCGRPPLNTVPAGARSRPLSVSARTTPGQAGRAPPRPPAGSSVPGKHAPLEQRPATHIKQRPRAAPPRAYARW